MSSQTPTPGTGWVITDQEEEVQIGAGNRINNGVRIYFRTQYGATGSIWVPRLTYTAQLVKQAVQTQATEMDTVHQLTG